MQTIEKLQAEQQKNQKKIEKDQKLKDLTAFLQDMEKQGLVKKQTYTIPPVDTIGKRLFESSIPKAQDPV